MSEQNPLKPLTSIPAEVLCAQDYETLAQHFLPEDRFAYICGGSGYERTLQQNRYAFNQFEIIPRPLASVGEGSTQCSFGSFELHHPIMLAPVAHQVLVHPRAELETARGAEATDTNMVCSTLSSQSLESIATHTKGTKWFQLYCQDKEADTLSLIERAQTSGFKALVVTLDAAVQVPSARAVRAGFKMPDEAVATNLSQISAAKSVSGDLFKRYAGQAVSRQSLQKIIEHSDLPVIVKGVLHPQDALILQELGAAGIVVSNHGGRTMDGVPASLSVLPGIRQAVGDGYPVAFDSGIRSGQDVFKALALGANVVMVGRLQVYALSIAGALGVAHMLKLLKEELALCMAVAGCTRISEITRDKLWNQRENLLC